MKVSLIFLSFFLVGRMLFEIVEIDSLKYLLAYLLGGLSLVVGNYYNMKKECRPAFFDYLKTFLFD